jgi:hypothetical protein
LFTLASNLKIIEIFSSHIGATLFHGYVRLCNNFDKTCTLGDFFVLGCTLSDFFVLGCTLGDFLCWAALWAIFCVGLHFGQFFLELIWSPWF